MPLVEKSQYRNVSGYVIGVVTLDRKGEPLALPLQPDDTVWLSEDERRATSRAPRADEDNPFANGSLARVTSDRVIDADTRPIDAPEAVEETAAPPAPAGDAPEGSFAATEEVATPTKAKPVEEPPARKQAPLKTAQQIKVRKEGEE